MGKMTPREELLTLDECRKRLGVTGEQLARLLQDGSVFGFDVDGVLFVPALLIDPAVNQKRLQKICRIVVPAPPASRLDFLTAPQGGHNFRNPLEMLENNQEYRGLLTEAIAWAAGWSRTTVTLYEGINTARPGTGESLYAASTEIDPRRSLWKRASHALRMHEFESPMAARSDVHRFTLLVERQTVGDAARILEAYVKVAGDDGKVAVEVKAACGGVLFSEIFSPRVGDGLVDIAKQVVDRLNLANDSNGL